MNPNEAQTKKQLIDRQIAKAGWNLNDRNEVRFEVPASGDDEDWTDGITDYSLYMPNGEIIALPKSSKSLSVSADSSAKPRARPNIPFKHCSIAPFVVSYEVKL